MLDVDDRFSFLLDGGGHIWRWGLTILIVTLSSCAAILKGVGRAGVEKLLSVSRRIGVSRCSLTVSSFEIEEFETNFEGILGVANGCKESYKKK